MGTKKRNKNKKKKQLKKNRNVFFENEEAKKVFDNLDLDLGDEPVIFSIDDGSGTTAFERMMLDSIDNYERVEIEIDAKDLK